MKLQNTKRIGVIKLVMGMIFLFIALIGCKESKQENADVKLAISDTLKWSERMALSVMKRNPKAFQIDGKEEPKWDYVHGLVLTGFEKLYDETKNRKYYDYVKEYVDT